MQPTINDFSQHHRFSSLSLQIEFATAKSTLIALNGASKAKNVSKITIIFYVSSVVVCTVSTFSELV